MAARQKAGVALADVAQRPIDGLADKVAIVEGVSFDESESFQEDIVGGGFVVDRKAGDGGEGRRGARTRACWGPFGDFGQAYGVRSNRQQQQASQTSQESKSRGPAVHGGAGDGSGVADQSRQDAGVFDPAVQSSSASAWFVPMLRASLRSCGTLRPSRLVVSIPKPAIPSRREGSATARIWFRTFSSIRFWRC